MTYSYVRKGCGPVLVLQHGFLSGATYWQQQIDFFAQSFDVIAPALPGFGGHDDGACIDSIAGYVDYLLGVLEVAGVDRFHLLGHSMGGMIAQETALTAGDRIDKLVLYGTGPNGLMPGRFESVSTSRQRVIEEGAAKTIERTVASWFMLERADESFDEGVALASLASLEAVVGGYDAMAGWKSVDRLVQIKNPTLVVWGDGDRAYKWDQVDLLVQGVKGARLKIVEGCCHNVHLESPTLFNQIVQDFLFADSLAS